MNVSVCMSACECESVYVFIYVCESVVFCVCKL